MLLGPGHVFKLSIGGKEMLAHVAMELAAAIEPNVPENFRVIVSHHYTEEQDPDGKRWTVSIHHGERYGYDVPEPSPYLNKDFISKGCLFVIDSPEEWEVMKQFMFGLVANLTANS